MNELPFDDGATAAGTGTNTVRTIERDQLVNMSPLQLAISSGASIDTIERMVALQERMEARHSESEFNAAMSRSQAAMGRVSADGNNPQTHSKYATYAALDRECRPIYTREGLALSFDTGDSTGEMVRVFCHVSHSAGHTRTYHLDMPNDGKGAKGGDVMTKTHAQGAAMSYAMRYLLKLIFNVAVGEDDRDGNTFDMPEGVFQDHLKAIRNAPTIEELQRVFGAAYTASNKDKETQKALVTAKDIRKGELRGVK